MSRETEATIEIELPGEDPEPPEYRKLVEFGETLREEFGDYRWTLGTLAATDGETVEVPPIAACIESAFRIQLAGTLAAAEFPHRVYDRADVDADFLLTDQDLGEETVAVTVTATRNGGSGRQAIDGPADGVAEHWLVELQYDLDEEAVVTADAVTNPAIAIEKL